MSDEQFTQAIEEDIAAGGPWATPAKPTRATEEAILMLGQAMILSAKQVKIGTGTSVLDRAQMVAGELEMLGFYVAPIAKEPQP